MIEKGRNGDVIETTLLKEVIGSFGRPYKPEEGANGSVNGTRGSNDG